MMGISWDLCVVGERWRKTLGDLCRNMHLVGLAGQRFK